MISECRTCDKKGDGYPGTRYFYQTPMDTCRANGHDIWTSCKARLAYRTMADIGSKATCGAMTNRPSGLCKRHDPETAPKRDRQGRIVKKETAYLRNVCPVCKEPMLGMHYHESE